MIDKLKDIELKIGELLDSIDNWQSLFIDYDYPYVERLYRQIDGCRVCLHKIHPSVQGKQPRFHPHPWPSAMKIITGSYEMGYGYSENPHKAPEIISRFIFTAGSYYEMTSPFEWHYVKPLNDKPVYSIMLSGSPFKEQKSEQPHLKPLSQKDNESIFQYFKNLYSCQV